YSVKMNGPARLGRPRGADIERMTKSVSVRVLHVLEIRMNTLAGRPFTRLNIGPNEFGDFQSNRGATRDGGNVGILLERRNCLIYELGCHTHGPARIAAGPAAQ